MQEKCVVLSGVLCSGGLQLVLVSSRSAVGTLFLNVCVCVCYWSHGAGVMCVCVCVCMLLPARVCEKHNTCAGVCLELILVSVCDCMRACVCPSLS